MTAVWYVGRADSRTITGAQWTAAGIGGAPATTTWDKTNGWSIPVGSFTAPQLAILAADADFNTAGADGPRPGASASPNDVSGSEVTRGFFDSAMAVVNAFIKKQKGLNPPLQRQRSNYRRLGPVTTDLTSVSNTAGHDATLTKSYTTTVSGLSPNQTRKMTDAEYAAQPYNIYPDTGWNPRIWNISGIGYVLNCGSPTTTVDASDPYWPNQTHYGIDVMTDAPAIEFLLYAWLGTTVSSIQAYVDGAPVTLTPQAFPGALSYYKITFPSGKKPRRVELVTDGILSFISIAPNYKCWKPPKRTGLKLMVMGASYVQPFVMDSGGAATQSFNRHGHWNQMDAWGDFDRLVIDGIGGTGFQRNASGGVGYPANKYTDRMDGVLKAKPDVMVFADAFSNDLYGGVSTDLIISAAKECIDKILVNLPDTKIVFQTGLRTPVYGDFSAGYDTIKAALKAAYPGKPIYFIDLRTAMDMTGGKVGATNGLGNSDFYIGQDAVHPVKEGCDYLRGWIYPALQRVLWDDGTLYGQDLI